MRFRCSCRWLFAAALMVVGIASAQTYPDKAKPIRVIAPFGVGTSTDVLARAVARGVAETSGVNLVIDNRVGGEGVIALQAAKTAPADGYTMLFTSLSTQVVNPHMFKQLSYDPVADFVPLVGLAKTPLMLNLGTSTTFNTAREFFAAAKAAPGKYTYGSASATTRAAGEILQREAGIQLLNVGYKNFTDAMSNLASGMIDLVLVDPATAGAFYKQGVRPVATTVATRLRQYPDVPTLREEGLKDFEVVGWFAAYFPAKTPPAAVAAMREILRAALKTKYVTDVYSTFAMEPLDAAGEQLDAFQRQELDRWGKAVRAAGLQGTL